MPQSSRSRSFAQVAIALALSVAFPVAAHAITVKAMAADPDRPFVYVISAGPGSLPDTVLFISTINDQITRRLPIGLAVTDVSVHAAEGRLYVTNMNELTRIVNLNTQAEEPPIDLASNAYRLNAGRPGRIYAEGLSQSIHVLGVDTGTGTTVSDTPMWEGDAAIDPTGHWYYHCDSNLPTARITRYDISTDTPVAGPTSAQHPTGSRNLVISGDGSRLVWRGFVYDADLHELASFNGDEIYAMTRQGEVAIGGARAYNTATGAILHTRAFSSSFHVVSGNQQKLYSYNPVTQGITVTPLAPFAAIPIPLVHPVPPDGGTVALPVDRLAWDQGQSNLTYRVYFGSDSSAVAAASPGSPVMIGVVTSPSITLSVPLVPGASYYWRVDATGTLSTVTGRTFRFAVAPLLVSPNPVTVTGVKGAAMARVPLVLTSVDGVRPWSVTHSKPWLSLDHVSGTTPDTVWLSFDTNAAAGNDTDLVRITTGEQVFDVPVNLGFLSLTLSKMVNDPARPYVYALHPGSGTQADAFVVAINTETHIVDKTIPIGRNPTDMTVNAGDDRLYVNNYQQTVTRVVDLATWTELSPLTLGVNTYRIDAGRPGRIYSVDEASPLYLRAIDSSTGAVVGTAGVSREGDGATDPAGHWFYQAEYNSSPARMTRYDISGDTPVANLTSANFTSGSRNLVISADGSRLFWVGYVLDPAMNRLRAIGEEIYATTREGAVALGLSHALNAVNGGIMATLPVATKVHAVSNDQTEVFSYNPTTHGIVITPMNGIVATTPAILPQPANQSTVVLPMDTLHWEPNPSAMLYRVFFGADSAAVAGAIAGSPLMLVETTNTTIPRPSGDMGGSYFWRVDVVGLTTTAPGNVWRFTIAPVVVSPNRMTVAAVQVGPPTRVTFGLTDGGVAQPWTVSESAAWISVPTFSGTTPDSVVVFLDTSTLAAGSHVDTLRFASGAYRFAVPVQINVAQLTLTKMVTDFERPYVYALHPGTGLADDAFVLFYNTVTNQIDKSIPVGRSPSDMTVHIGEGRLYVAARGQPLTRVVDLVAQDTLPSLALGTDVVRINAGRPGRVYVEGYGNTATTLRTIDTGNGTVVGSANLLYGDGATDPAGRWYYHCDNSGGNRVSRFDITGDTPVIGPLGPLRVPGTSNIVIAGDGSRIFWRGYAYDPAVTELIDLGEEIYAATVHGGVAFSANHAIDTRTGVALASLSVNTTVRAVSGDQQKLFSYNTTTHAVVVTPMSAITSVPGPGLFPTPAPASTVVLPLDSLSWYASPVAVGYRVYFGIDSSAVAGAMPGSPLTLGEPTTSAIPIGALDLGQTYYWRIDVVGFSSTTPSAVLRFTVAPIVVSPKRVAIRIVKDAPTSPVSLTLTAAEAHLPWTVAESASWFSVSSSSGATPDSVSLTFDTSALSPGNYSDTLRFASGGYQFRVAVDMQFALLNLTRMVTDPERPYIYALHPGGGITDDAFLMFINTETNLIDKAMPVGTNPTDLTVNRAEGRLYVTNSGQPVTRVVDLTTRVELGPLFLGTNVHRINAGRSGRVYVEGKTGPTSLRVIDTATADSLSSTPVLLGDGATDPTGQWYYHCDNDLETAVITRYDISTDVPLAGAVSPVHLPGSRNLVIAGDGSRLFWRRFVYDANLTELRALSEEIYASSFHGEMAFGVQRVFNAVNGATLATLPFASGVRAVSSDQQKLFSFNETTHAVTMTPISTIAPVPGPALNPVPTHASTVLLPLDTLRWNQNSLALRYRVYFGSDSTAIASAVQGSPWTIAEPTEPLTSIGVPTAQGETYYWRVDVVGFAATTTGSVWRFTAAPISVAPSRIAITGLKGTPHTILPLVLTTGIPEQVWSLTESAPWLSLDQSSGTIGALPDTVRLTFDVTALNPGTYRDTLRITAGTLQFSIPVDLKVAYMAVTRMVTDFERPFVYALHPGATANDEGILLVLSTQTEAIVKMLPIGKGASDMTVHSAEGRLYVSNWGQPVTRVVDLDTHSELPPLALGTDVYRINFGRAGRVYTEGKTGSMRGIDTETGAVVNTKPLNAGDAAVEPLGKWYYHSDSRITRYDVRTDVPVAGPKSPVHVSGADNLVMCDDGSRIFWHGYVYDEALVELNNLAVEVVAASRYGNVAYTATQAIRVADRAVLGTLFSSTVRAISGDQTKLFSFDAFEAKIKVTPSYVPVVVDVEAPPAIPVRFALDGVFPNPLGSSGQPTIRFALPSDEDATLEVMDIQGRCVWRHTLSAPIPGEYSVLVAPTVRFSSGVYFLRLQQAHERATKRLVVTR